MDAPLEELLKIVEEVGSGKRSRNDLPVEVIVYHGTRSFMNEEEIKKYGICAWENPGSAVSDVMQALKALGVDPGSEVFQESAVMACQWASKPQLSLTAYKDAACIWAKNSPELISFPVYLHGDGEEKEQLRVREYLEEHFGKPYRVTVKRKTGEYDVYTPQDIRSGLKCLTSDMILEVEECK